MAISRFSSVILLAGMLALLCALFMSADARSTSAVLLRGNVEFVDASAAKPHGGAEPDPSSDRQTTTYNSMFPPKTVVGSATITPFFSPDGSTSTLTDLVQSATSSIDIYTPSYSSWSGCTPFSGCMPCSVSFMRNNETFPLFPAMINKVHQGVKVRLITNDYSDNVCDGAIGPLEYLVLAGVQVRYYTTTTFVHVKYTAVDTDTSSGKAAVSSVNFSYTSYLENREAGVVIANNNDLVQYYRTVFEKDWAQAVPLQVTQKYSPSDMAIINDKTPIPVIVPPNKTFECRTDAGPVVDVQVSNTNMTAFVSPDYALQTLLSELGRVQNTLDVSIYQINSPEVADALISLFKAGKKLRIFTSNYIFDKDDNETTQVQYKRMYEAGLTIYQSARYCLTFSHEKFWIIDGHRVMMSSGNWAPTDFEAPASNTVFPPYGNNGWVHANRDLQFMIDSADVAAQFQKVFDLDFSQAYIWKPSREKTTGN